MGAGEPTTVNWVMTALPWAGAIILALSLLLLVGILVRRLSARWRREAGELMARLPAALQQSERRLAALEIEAGGYSPDLAPPYHERVQHLRDRLSVIDRCLMEANDCLVEIPMPPLTIPVTRTAAMTYMLWSEPQARRKRRARLQVLEEELRHLDHDFATSESLLKQLRRTPLEAAELARELHAHLDAAFETQDTLHASGLRGESLDRVAHSLSMEAESLASLPSYLFDKKESQILRKAQPIPISQVWQALVELKPQVDASLETLAGWRRALYDLRHTLAVMHQATTNARDRLAEANEQLDLTDLTDAWHTIQALAEEVDRRFKTPTPEDLADYEDAGTVTEQANDLVAKLAAIEAFRLSLNARIAENEHRIDEVERQLRQLAESPRYPLDRVPFQTELDRLRQRLNGVKEVGRPRQPKHLETDLATLQVLDRQMLALAERVTTAREDRRRLVELLDETRSTTAAPEGSGQVDWLTWARDLAVQTSTYALECWQGEDGLHVATLLDDAEALDARRRRWVPARVDDLLVPETLGRQVREVAGVREDIEALQNRLDQVTSRLQHLRQTEETARARLQSVYGALDRLEIVASELLPAELAGEDNHWTRVREHLDAGYSLDLALGSPGTGSVMDKAERVTRWVEASAATLHAWHRILLTETEAAANTISHDLEDLGAIARLDGEPPVQRANEALRFWEASAPKRAERVERSIDALPATCRRLASEVSDQLRILARLDEVATGLEAQIFTLIADPVAQWHDAQLQAEQDFNRLKALEAQSARSWPPLSCDTVVVQPEIEFAEQLQRQLLREETAVAQVVATAEELTALYSRISTLVSERESGYHAMRPKLEALLDRIDDWCNDLKAYGKQHGTNPVVVSAIRARLDEIEASFTQLHLDYGKGQDLVPGDEALRVLDGLWRQASRDVPVGAGMNVIPVDWIARPH